MITLLLLFATGDIIAGAIAPAQSLDHQMQFQARVGYSVSILPHKHVGYMCMSCTCTCTCHVIAKFTTSQICSLHFVVQSDFVKGFFIILYTVNRGDFGLPKNIYIL